MITEPASIQFTHKTWDVKQSPIDPTQLLLTILLTATTTLSASDVDAVKDRVLREGIRVYVTGNIETELLAAMRVALLRAEAERDQYATRALHFQTEYEKALIKIESLETELTEKRKTLGFLEEGLRRTVGRS